jgi:hypothetical protein
VTAASARAPISQRKRFIGVSFERSDSGWRSGA